MKNHFSFLLLIAFLNLAVISCKPPRSPIKDSRVRMVHRYDGELNDATLPNKETGPPAMSTDATRIEEEPKGLKKIFGKFFKKKPKAGPDENDLKVEINPNAESSQPQKSDSAKFNVDQVYYEKFIRVSADEEVRLNADPKKEYSGVPWWYYNKNPKIGQGYKPGYRYPGYKEITTADRVKYQKKAIDELLKRKAKYDKLTAKDSVKRAEAKIKFDKEQEEEKIRKQEEEKNKITNLFDDDKKKGGLFRKKKKKSDDENPKEDNPKEDKPKEDKPKKDSKEGF